MFYNQKSISSTTTSPYFTPAVIDNACYACANEVGSSQSFSSQCDICKTLTVEEITTYGYFDFIVLMAVPLFFCWVVFLFIKKHRK